MFLPPPSSGPQQRTARTISAPALRPAFGLVVLLTALPLFITSCASTRDEDRSSSELGTDAPGTQPKGALASLALREEKAPGLARPDYSPVWGAPDSIALLAAQDLAASAPALLPLEAWLATLPPPPAMPEVREPPYEAIRLFVSGRLKLNDNKFAEAAKDLSESARLDPTATAPLRELALAQAAQGQRASSMSTLRRAIDRGLADPQSLWLLGRDELRQRNSGQATNLLGRAFVEARNRPGSELHRLISADLAESLRQTGHLAAARELFAIAATPGQATASYSIFRVEAMELARRTSDLWTIRGDLALRLGLVNEALDDYSRSLEGTPSDPVGVGLRIATAHIRSGRPATAAKFLVDSISRSGGTADPRQVVALAEVAHATTIADALVQDLNTLSEDRSIGARAAGRLVRAVATGLPAPRATKLLRDRLSSHPDDPAALAALLETHPATDTQARLDELVWFVNRHPLRATEAASTALLLGRDLDAMSGLLATPSSPGAHLFSAALQAARGRGQEALDSLRSSPLSPELEPARHLLLTRIAMLHGEWATVSTSLGALTSPQAPATLDGPLPVIWGLRSAQHFSAAADRAEAWIAAHGEFATASDLVLAAAIALDSGRFQTAASLYARAMQSDPSDERGYAGLSSITEPDGPAPDNTIFTATGRAARKFVPGSTVIRIYQFRDLLLRRQYAQAEALIRSLNEPGNELPELLDLLPDVWKAMGQAVPKDAAQFAPAEAWIAERRKGREDSADLTLVHARLLLVLNRPAEAEALLQQAFSKQPMPRLRAALAEVLAGPLGRPSDGRALLHSEISRTPRAIEEALLWASVCASAGQWADAAQAVSEIPADIELTPPQITDLLTIFAARAAKQKTPLSDTDSTALASIFDRAHAWRIPFELQLHALRLDALCSMNPANAARIAKAVDDTRNLGPEKHQAALGEALSLLTARNDIRTAIDVIAISVESMPSPSSDLYGAWIQLVVARGTPADADRAIRSPKDAAPIKSILEKISNRLSPLPTTDAGLRAELAFSIGNDWSSMNREPDAFAMYRLALAIDPSHGWAANNLGYALLESEGTTPEAVRLIELAARLLPTESSVVDSLAWLRYKQGRFNDDPAGTEGAITLLRRAIALPGGLENADLHDHLGDALYRTNDTADAVLSWKTAVDLLTSDIARAQRLNAPPDFTSKLLESARLIRQKVEDVTTTGNSPKVAPLAAEAAPK